MIVAHQSYHCLQAGANAGVQEGERIAADKTMYSSLDDLAHIAAQRGAIVGAQLGAKVCLLG